MTRSISWCLIICVAAIIVVCAIAKPEYLSDKNEFLHHFVNQELLALLGIIMTITLASVASLHLEFNKVEERVKKRFLVNTRRGVQQGAYALIVLFALSVVLVVVKPLIHSGEVAVALANGLAVLIVFFNVMILLELTHLAFGIQPNCDGP